jgi:hypothetical protein
VTRPHASFVLIGLGVAVLGICATYFLYPRSSGSEDKAYSQAIGLRHVSLPQLPSGALKPPTLQSVDELVQPVEFTRRATVVFTGTAIEKGSNETVSPESADTGFAITVHRIRFHVINVFRGPRADTIDLTVLDVEDADPFVIGQRYVVFAEPRTFGDETASRLAPVGYGQGAFHIAANTNERTEAHNSYGDSVNPGNPLGGVTGSETTGANQE